MKKIKFYFLYMFTFSTSIAFGGGSSPRPNELDSYNKFPNCIGELCFKKTAWGAADYETFVKRFGKGSETKDPGGITNCYNFEKQKLYLQLSSALIDGKYRINTLFLNETISDN